MRIFVWQVCAILLLLSFHAAAAQQSSATKRDWLLQQPTAKQVSTALKAIIEAASNDFKVIKGAQKPESTNYFVAKVAFPGMKDCMVVRDTALSEMQGRPVLNYSCRLEAPMPDIEGKHPIAAIADSLGDPKKFWLSSAIDSFNNLVKALRAELGEDCGKTEKRGGLFSMRFEAVISKTSHCRIAGVGPGTRGVLLIVLLSDNSSYSRPGSIGLSIQRLE